MTYKTGRRGHEELRWHAAYIIDHTHRGNVSWYRAFVPHDSQAELFSLPDDSVAFRSIRGGNYRASDEEMQLAFAALAES